jgi:hypothetical protein
MLYTFAFPCGAEYDLQWQLAQQRGIVYEDCGKNAIRVLQGWLDLKEDPQTHLYSKGKAWDYHNEAADHYSSLVLVAQYVKPEWNRPGGPLHRTLGRSIELCKTKMGIPTLYDLQRYEQGAQASLKDLSEWLRDGLVRIVEILGTENDWYREMMRLTDAMIAQAERGDGMGSAFPDSESAGNMLQTLTRLYVMSGNAKYLDAAEALADYHLLGGGTLLQNVTFGDHGCELVPGLGELFVLESRLQRPKAAQYGDPLRNLLDRILAQDAHPQTGLLCGSETTEDGKREWKQPPDTWGYVLFTYENYDRATGGDRYTGPIEKSMTWLIEHRSDFLQLEDRLWPRAKSSDDWSDSYESMIVLWNRYPRVQGVYEWLDWATHQHVHRKNEKAQYGPYTGGHFDGSTGRALCMHMMLNSQGVRSLPFVEGLRLGGIQEDGALYLTLESTTPWDGALHFDGPRTVYPIATLDWTRLNEMPQWFVAHPGRTYMVVMDGQPPVMLDGKDLIDGLVLTARPSEIRRIRVIEQMD